MTACEFKAIRTSMGFTQEEFARRIGCSYNAVFKAERAYQGYGVSSIMASCALLLKENYRLRNEILAYRTGDKEFVRKSNKTNRLQALHQQKAMIEDQIRREGDPVEK